MSREISSSQISQTIDLVDAFGREPTPSEIAGFQQEALETIIIRTQDGKDWQGKSFPDYTTEYAEEKGVSVGDVDLTDFGDMLLGIESSTQGGSIVLKMDDNEVGKAHGNITGSYGQPSPNKSKARDFFGLSEKEIGLIADQVRETDEPAALDLASLFATNNTVTDIDIESILTNIGLAID